MKLEDENICLNNQINTLTNNILIINKETNDFKSMNNQLRQTLLGNEEIIEFLTNENKSFFEKNNELKLLSDDKSNNKCQIIETKLLKEISCLKENNLSDKNLLLNKIKRENEISQIEISNLINEKLGLNSVINHLREILSMQMCEIECKNLNIKEKDQEIEKIFNEKQDLFIQHQKIENLEIKLNESNNNNKEKSLLLEKLQNENFNLNDNLSKTFDNLEILNRKLKLNLDNKDLLEKSLKDNIELQSKINEKIMIIEEINNQKLEYEEKNLEMNKELANLTKIQTELNKSIINYKSSEMKNFEKIDELNKILIEKSSRLNYLELSNNLIEMNNQNLKNEINNSEKTCLIQVSEIKSKITEIQLNYDKLEEKNIFLIKNLEELENEIKSKTTNSKKKYEILQKEKEDLEKEYFNLKKNYNLMKVENEKIQFFQLEISEMTTKINEKEEKNLKFEIEIEKLQNEISTSNTNNLNKFSNLNNKLKEFEIKCDLVEKENTKLKDDNVFIQNRNLEKLEDLNKKIKELEQNNQKFAEENKKLKFDLQISKKRFSSTVPELNQIIKDLEENYKISKIENENLKNSSESNKKIIELEKKIINLEKINEKLKSNLSESYQTNSPIFQNKKYNLMNYTSHSGGNQINDESFNMKDSNKEYIDKLNLLLKEKETKIIELTRSCNLNELKITNLNNKLRELGDKCQIVEREKETINRNMYTSENLNSNKINDFNFKFNELEQKIIILKKENQNLTQLQINSDKNYLLKISTLNQNIEDSNQIKERMEKEIDDLKRNKIKSAELNEIIEKQNLKINDSEKKILQLESKEKKILSFNISLKDNLNTVIELIKYLCDSLYRDEYFLQLLNEIEEEEDEKENHSNLLSLVDDLNEDNLIDVSPELKILSTCLNGTLFSIIEKLKKEKKSSNKHNLTTIESLALNTKTSKIIISNDEIKEINENDFLRIYKNKEQELIDKIFLLEEKEKSYISNTGDLTNKYENLKSQFINNQNKFSTLFYKVYEETNNFILNIKNKDIKFEIIDYKINNDENQLITLLRETYHILDKEISNNMNYIKKSTELNIMNLSKAEESFKKELNERLIKERERITFEIKKENQEEMDILKSKIKEIEKEKELMTLNQSLLKTTQNNNKIDEKNDVNLKEETNLKIKEKEILELKDIINNLKKVNNEINNQLIITEEKLKSEKENFTYKEKEYQLNLKIRDNQFTDFSKDSDLVTLNETLKKKEEEIICLNKNIDQFIKEKKEHHDKFNAEIDRVRKEMENLKLKNENDLKNIDENIKQSQENLELKFVKSTSNSNDFNTKIEEKNLKTKLFNKRQELQDYDNKIIKYHNSDNLTCISSGTNENQNVCQIFLTHQDPSKKNAAKKFNINALYKGMTIEELIVEIEKLLLKISDLEDDIKSKLESYSSLEKEYLRAIKEHTELMNNYKNLEIIFQQLNNKSNLFEKERRLEDLTIDSANDKFDIKLNYIDISAPEKNLKNLYIKIKEDVLKNEELTKLSNNSQYNKEREKKILIENKDADYFFDEILNYFKYYIKNINELKILENKTLNERKVDDQLLYKELLIQDDDKTEFNILFGEEVNEDFIKIKEFIQKNTKDFPLDSIMTHIEENYWKISNGFKRLLKIIIQLKEQIRKDISSFKPTELIFYDPKKYKIYCFKTVFNIRLCLLIFIKEDQKKITFRDMIWVSTDSIKVENYEKMIDSSIDKERGKK